MNVPNYPPDVPLHVVAAAADHAMIFDVTPMSATATSVYGEAIGEHGNIIDGFTHVED